MAEYLVEERGVVVGLELVLPVPVGDVRGRAPKFVQSNLTQAQGEALVSLVEGARRAGVALSNGSPVHNGATYLRWLLERAGEGLDG